MRSKLVHTSRLALASSTEPHIAADKKAARDLLLSLLEGPVVCEVSHVSVVKRYG